MKNGNVNEFVDGLYYGDERIFLYRGQKFFIEGLSYDNKNHLILYRWEPTFDHIWESIDEIGPFRVEKFLSAPLFDGKTFWEVESEIEWVDD